MQSSETLFQETCVPREKGFCCHGAVARDRFGQLHRRGCPLLESQLEKPVIGPLNGAPSRQRQDKKSGKNKKAGSVYVAYTLRHTKTSSG